MNNLGKYLGELALTGSLLTGGCGQTPEQTCINRVTPATYPVLHECDHIQDSEATATCKNLVRATHGTAMAACMTQMTGVANACTETGWQKFDCESK